MAKKMSQIEDFLKSIGRTFIPIGWFSDSGFCELQAYQLYCAGVPGEITRDMELGKKRHEQLYQNFLQGATRQNLREILERSKSREIDSERFFVYSATELIGGEIDHVKFRPEAFYILDYKRQSIPHKSYQEQILNYCLAFQDLPEPGDERLIVAVLINENTVTPFWVKIFTPETVREIQAIKSHFFNLLCGNIDPVPASESELDKCKHCKIRRICPAFDHKNGIQVSPDLPITPSLPGRHLVDISAKQEMLLRDEILPRWIKSMSTDLAISNVFRGTKIKNKDGNKYVEVHLQGNNYTSLGNLEMVKRHLDTEWQFYLEQFAASYEIKGRRSSPLIEFPQSFHQD